MKKLLLISLLLLIGALAARADVTINSTNFPDANFRAYLLSQYPSGTITTSQLNSRTTLDVSQKQISNLGGIQYFVGLTTLRCYSNNLTSLNLSSNTRLTYVDCSDNNLSNLDASTLTALKTLRCQNNHLTNLDISSSAPDLETVICNNNDFTMLFLSNYPALKTLDASACSTLYQLSCNNSALTSLEVANCSQMRFLSCGGNKLTELNLRGCDGLKNLYCPNNQLTELEVDVCPLLEDLYCDGNPLTYLEACGMANLKNLSVANCSELEILLCYEDNLNRLIVTGCTALNDLQCFDNDNLTSITDIHQCTNLGYFDCEGCKISSFIMTRTYPYLRTFNAPENNLSEVLIYSAPNLTSVNLENNAALTRLTIQNCGVASMNITGCDQIQTLDLENNQFTELDLSYRDALTSATITGHSNLTRLNLNNCPSLETLYCQNNGLTSLLTSASNSLKTLNCSGNQLTSLSLSSPELISADCSSNQLSTLTPRCAKLERLNCSNNNLRQLNLAYSPALRVLDCSYNQLTRLSPVVCQDLTTLYCNDNLLTALYVSECPALTGLYCSNNQLTGLDVSGCPALTDLFCYDNQLTGLDVRACEAIMNIGFFHNQIKGQQLDDMIAGLPVIANGQGILYALYSDAAEGNLFTSTQAMNAMNKNWYVGKHIEDPNYQFTQYFIDAFYMWDDTVTAGSTFTIPVYLSSGNFNLMMCKIFIPDGFELLNVEKGLACGDNASVSFANSDQYTDDGRRYRNLMFVNPQVEDYPENPVLMLTFKAPAATGESLVSLENILVTRRQQEEFYSSYVKITVGGGVMIGDVNSDGEVNISDAITLISAVLNDNFESINMANADVTGEGDVNISDAIALISMVLNN
ncbi:MAG: leucine-rich repeat domain-containing protein [Muribaculaceae bacterium]|nr:leucine-rich repeat domain-containing protein [Muribaculaceae bacterium]